MSILNVADNGCGRHSLFGFVIAILNIPVKGNIKMIWKLSYACGGFFLLLRVSVLVKTGEIQQQHLQHNTFTATNCTCFHLLPVPTTSLGQHIAVTLLKCNKNAHLGASGIKDRLEKTWVLSGRTGETWLKGTCRGLWGTQWLFCFSLEKKRL